MTTPALNLMCSFCVILEFLYSGLLIIKSSYASPLALTVLQKAFKVSVQVRFQYKYYVYIFIVRMNIHISTEYCIWIEFLLK